MQVGLGVCGIWGEGGVGFCVCLGLCMWVYICVVCVRAESSRGQGYGLNISLIVLPALAMPPAALSILCPSCLHYHLNPGVLSNVFI